MARSDIYDSCNAFYKYDEERIIFHRNTLNPKSNKILIVDIFGKKENIEIEFKSPIFNIQIIDNDNFLLCGDMYLFIYNIKEGKIMD